LRTATDFDRPDAVNLLRAASDLEHLLEGSCVRVPIYGTHVDAKPIEVRSLAPAPLIILEGLFALYHPSLTNLFTHKVFLDVPADIRLARRIRRDVKAYGLDVEEVCSAYVGVIRPNHERFVEPTKSSADFVLSCEDVDAFAFRVAKLLQESPI
jgi:uridine kinase